MLAISPPAMASSVADEAAPVGRMVDSSQSEDRKMIRLVRERPLLYARNNMPVASVYSRVKGLWREVADQMGWSVMDVRRKWSHVRNSYSRHLRNEIHGARTGRGRRVSRWYLADELDFLREHMATDLRMSPTFPYSASLLEIEGIKSPQQEPVETKPFINNPWLSIPSTFEPKAEPPSNDDSCSSTFEADENSSFFQFFRGIHNDYQELSARRQRIYKKKCLDFLLELLDEQDSTQSPLYQSGAINLSNSSHASDDEREHKVCVVEHLVELPPASD
ncbi:uncharacterized protein LOC135078401 [Ostrinia nubilalis]|uniref:uncharacterized protein LOC114351592 n=1 Tax=Ostrinia furnacalis TaxID=93504 RepID=UPI00103C1B83|nr:uncharacterized protein LOC114351592 [Ostrinia furnacalis]